MGGTLWHVLMRAGGCMHEPWTMQPTGRSHSADCRWCGACAAQPVPSGSHMVQDQGKLLPTHSQYEHGRCMLSRAHPGMDTIVDEPLGFSQELCCKQHHGRGAVADLQASSIS